MAYTPINWQTGDTITAEKMNKMDNGWGTQLTQLFSESVTTADDGGMNVGTLVYSDTIDADSIVVTFNGTDYTCSRIDAFGHYYYGGFSQSGPDFSEYPFAIESSTSRNNIYTQTAGTYTVAVSTSGIVVSDDFCKAVGKGISVPIFSRESVSAQTYEYTCNMTFSEIKTAIANGTCFYSVFEASVFNLAYYTASEIVFSSILVTTTSVSQEEIIYSSNGTITMETTTYPSSN